MDASTLDKDGDGVVDMDELDIAFGRQGSGFMAIFDADGDGKLSRDEMRAMKGAIAQKDKAGKFRVLRADAAVEMVREKIASSVQFKLDYKSFFFMLIYFALVFQVMSMRDDPGQQWTARNKIVDNLFRETFDADSTTLDSAGDIVETLDGRGNIEIWFGRLVDRVFTDTTCGDSVCLGELAQWKTGPHGDFEMGCEPDCGRYPNQAEVSIKITGVLATKVPYQSTLVSYRANQVVEETNGVLAPVQTPLPDSTAASFIMHDPLAYVMFQVCYDTIAEDGQSASQFGLLDDPAQQQGCLQSASSPKSLREFMASKAADGGYNHGKETGRPEAIITDMHSDYKWDTPKSELFGASVRTLEDGELDIRMNLIDGPYRMRYYIQDQPTCLESVQTAMEVCGSTAAVSQVDANGVTIEQKEPLPMEVETSMKLWLNISVTVNKVVQVPYFPPFNASDPDASLFLPATNRKFESMNASIVVDNSPAYNAAGAPDTQNMYGMRPGKEGYGWQQAVAAAGSTRRQLDVSLNESGHQNRSAAEMAEEARVRRMLQRFVADEEEVESRIRDVFDHKQKNGGKGRRLAVVKKCGLMAYCTFENFKQPRKDSGTHVCSGPAGACAALVATATEAERAAACGCSTAECCVPIPDAPPLNKQYARTPQRATPNVMFMINGANAELANLPAKYAHQQNANRRGMIKDFEPTPLEPYFNLADNERYIGEVNKILGGILVTTTRYSKEQCSIHGEGESTPFLLTQLGLGLSRSREAKIDGSYLGCLSEEAEASCPYGSDPAFMKVQKEYEPPDGGEPMKLYVGDDNAEIFKTFAYGEAGLTTEEIHPAQCDVSGASCWKMRSDYTSQATVAETAEECNQGKNLLYNEKIPYGFHHMSKQVEQEFLDLCFAREENSFEPGFSIYFDAQLNSRFAKKYLAYMSNGFYLDYLTASIRFDMMTFNGLNKQFALITVVMEIDENGQIEMGYEVNSMKSSYYLDGNDALRFGLEILMIAFMALQIFGELGELVQERFAYFLSFWNLFDWGHNILIAYLVFSWWSFNTATLENFNPQTRYRIYDGLNKPARMITLNRTSGPLTHDRWLKSDRGGTNETNVEMKKFLWDLGEMEYMTAFISGARALQSYVMMLFLVRILKAMRFQPRLGVVTRTLAAGFDDLIHFIIVCSVITIIFAFTGMYLLGSAVQAFSTFDKGIITTIRMLLGETEVLDEIERLPSPVPAYIWFFSYMVVGSMVLLNVLLAILVDAYADQQAPEASTFLEDIQMLVTSNAKLIYERIRYPATFLSNGTLIKTMETIAEKSYPDPEVSHRCVDVLGGAIGVDNDGNLQEEDEEESLTLPPFRLRQKELVDALVGCLAGQSSQLLVKGNAVDEDFLRRVARVIINRFGAEKVSRYVLLLLCLKLVLLMPFVPVVPITLLLLPPPSPESCLAEHRLTLPFCSLPAACCMSHSPCYVYSYALDAQIFCHEHGTPRQGR